MNRHGDKNPILIEALFWATLIFSVTALKHIWAIEGVARVVNSAALLGLACFATYSLFGKTYPRSLWYWLILPTALVIGGITLNIAINAILYANVTKTVTTIIPWLACLSVFYLEKHGLVNSEALWDKFYKFMLWANIFGVLEYLAVFAGAYAPRAIETPYGDFLSGNFSIFYFVNSDEIHYRYYACFLEPGTLAMYLLPAIIYSIAHKKYLGFALFCAALYMTDSLGGYISLALIFMLLPFVIAGASKRKLWRLAPISILIAAIIAFAVGGSFYQQYENRGNSREVREQTLSKTITTLPTFVLENPFGSTLADTTDEQSKNTSYLGMTFTPAIYLQTGGLISFLGYIASLIAAVSLSLALFTKPNLDVTDKIIFSSILVTFPFAFQRTTFFETPIFALLFLPSIIRQLRSISADGRKDPHLSGPITPPPGRTLPAQHE